MEYTWDENKAKSNFEKHGARFEEAQVIWTDPLSIEYFDPDNSFREERFIRIGLNPTRGILFVVFCEKEKLEVIRIISARKATNLERKDYEEELQSQRT
ncbi:MAG: BrnT family toxin [Bacteriovorax sp.]|nr:BrnT family toxin [Bacteriovorax sp.]